MKARDSLPFALVTSLALAFLAGASAAWGEAPEERENLLTGIWTGTFVTEKEIVSNGYLDVTQHADGTLTGKWGNSPKSVLTIERGECVTPEVFQWEAASSANTDGRYRVRATLRGKNLLLDVTYTWRENGKIKGQTAVSNLTRK